MSRAVVGIDPGLDGALARWNGEVLVVEDMPTLAIGKGRVIDAYALARIIDDWCCPLERPHVAWIEFVASSPQMGVASSFKFGEGYGLVKGVLAANFLTIETVTPPKWKRTMEVRGDKDESRAKAAALFPRQSGLFARDRDHGRADAALIAVHGWRVMQQRIGAAA